MLIGLPGLVPLKQGLIAGADGVRPLNLGATGVLLGAEPLGRDACQADRQDQQ